MRLSILFLSFFLLLGASSCKKNSGNDEQDNGNTQIATLEAAYAASESVYGMKYTFKVQFSNIGKVTEFGVVYKPWIRDKANKTPTIGDAESSKLPFTGTPSTGVVLTGEITLRYADFNDANYRAYAITSSGEVVYGTILYISFA
ncbi:MAG: hypothetical protein JNL51_08995 [Chitinophagaceae bacterium]|nr:hypothetical protein [Chitinophagaceae bacterium]